ncbi:MAG: septal ring lytic transglycosylase RlpA family protein, partial [Desulfobacterales bacterium]|nr:septal ring lytic transglycosylase RlpA family protein [Desulfobacterales bacterium]
MIKYPKLCNLQFAICVALSLFLLSCAAPEKRPAPLPGYPKPYKIGKRWYQPLERAPGFRERGMASWYGKEFHGRKTASGEAYNMYAFTAAHKTLPLGTYVSVYNLNNGKRADVRINDRGPFVRDRIIDLSYEAAQRIGLVGPGTVPVEIVALGSVKETVVGGKVQRTLVPGNYYVGDFTIQVGAFKYKENAIRLRNKLAQTHKNAHIVVYESAKGT